MEQNESYSLIRIWAAANAIAYVCVFACARVDDTEGRAQQTSQKKNIHS